ncbi:DJ-1 family glyoxalase III [Ructibacterium gallinarum]|uniref:DJ-1/PfpI family protein n=1 Tax=Ructibacterium gallinarum TaxID=2779355 RepID=A0A9D5LXU5_9FIRM|nr:DJ-1 family glyoxalase III [Ructibacterium gallinarum]MBE5039918.1 DJ-1/PfpI family protein [Ructibacterium gallinarum]
MLYLLLADGFEETEAIAPLDVIRRAGMEIKTVGVTGEVVTGSHGIAVHADLQIDDIFGKDMDGVILPGGMPGTLHLQKSLKVAAILQRCYKRERMIAAICAAPMVLGGMGLLKGRQATCFPGFEEKLEGAILSEKFVVRDGQFITAKGAGAALAFGAEIVNYFAGETESGKGQEILAQMQTPGL